MKTLNTAALVALAAFALITTGCGDFPDAPERVSDSDGLVHFESHSLGSSDRFSAADLVIAERADTTRIDRVTPALVEDDELDSQPIEAWDDTANDPVVLPIYTEGERNADVAEVAPMPAGFADGCASRDEWSRLADSVCDIFDATVAHVTLGDGCGQQQYRVTNFGCMLSGDHKSETTYREFTSVLLGDETACKSISSLRDTATDICGTEGSVIELKGLAECDNAEDSEEVHYKAARVTCTDRD